MYRSGVSRCLGPQGTSRLAKAALKSNGVGRARALLRRMLRETHALALVEFALMLPVFVVLGMYGTEIAYMSSVNMQVSQIALSVADNASRLGQDVNNGGPPTISEGLVDSVMFGALKEGDSLNLEKNGRVILSSLEEDHSSGSSVQFIHWQRCRGELNKTSLYGEADDTVTGVGKSGTLKAEPGSAVMVAEVYYDYPGLFGDLFTKGMTFRQEAVMTIRDDRDLQGPTDAGLIGGPSQSVCP